MNLSRMVSTLKEHKFGAGLFLTAAFVTWVTHASLDGSDDLRLTPLSVTLTSDANLPAEVKAQEAATVNYLFDRDTTTEFTAFAENSIHVQFDGAQSVENMKLYGPSAYRLSVRYFYQGIWQTINEWTNLDLSTAANEWNSYALKSAIMAEALELTFVPDTGKGNSGNSNTNNGNSGKGKGNSSTTTTTTSLASATLKELSFWGKGNRTLITSVTALDNTLQQDKANIPSYVKSYNATPEQAVVNLQGTSFSLNLPYATNHIEKVWLSYDVYGVNHWVSVKRQINGHAAVGGEYQFTQNQWKTVYEPIHSQWLTQGTNTIQFSLPSDVTGSYRIRDLRLLVLLDDGAHFEQTITASPQSSINDVTLSHDGDTDTGWQPYLNATEKNQKPYLQIDFEKSMQLDHIRLYALNRINGSINVDVLEGEQWVTGSNAIAGGKINSGWNTFDITSTASIKGLRLTFTDNGKSNLEIREIIPVASGIGALYEPNIAVTYPLNGEYFGRSAYIRGYLNVEDNGSGKANLFIGGKAVTHDAGEFATLISKEDVQLSEQADDIAWQVTIEAVYPDGKKLTKIVTLNNYADNSETEGTLPHVIAKATPGDKNIIEYDEAELELTEGALDKQIEIRISSLKHDDLPALDPGMTNVTRGPRNGYRFTPHGTKFTKNIKVKLPYDENLIPSGLTLADVKTYFFDEETGHWVPLEKVAIEVKTKRLISHTTHFTDMINATITVPDSPQAASFNPTQIKDIKAADPGAGINLIEPPQANNQGSANVSYPIEIPVGRNGMQPQLAIQYNSGGGNGWLGLGWDLSVPSVTIDTRWGVPRYSTTKETETYMLAGQQMTPLVHRQDQDNLPARQADKDDFHMRVEGSFQKIKRHGTSPNNYWWEVTDKNGTRYFYGSDGSTQDADSVLGSNKGVFKWMLKKTMDTNGNTIVYNYDKVCDTGIGSGGCSSGVEGHQLYLSSIDYTGHASKDAPYHVEFKRDKELGNPRRADVTIDARGGFKQVTSELLKEIKVKYNSELVRSYELEYQTGAFKKTLLKTIVQKDKDGNVFNRHELAYFDEVTRQDNTIALFDTAKDVSTGSDNIKEPLFGVVKYPTTLMGGSLGAGASGNGFVGIGPPFFGKYVHGAATISASANFSINQISLIDIDGDGLQDKVFEKDGQIFYRKNITNVEDDDVKFSQGQPVSVANLTRLSKNRSTSWSKGGKALAFIFNSYASSAKNTSTEDIYFSDINGDGLIDQVNSGSVRFNTIENGAPKFTTDSGNTEAPIIAGGVNAETLLADMAGERKLMEDENPLMDAIRVWKAPYAGRITISSTAQLHDYTTDPSLTEGERRIREEYKLADGVRLTVQHNSTVKTTVNLGGEEDERNNQYAPVAINIPALSVNSGDTLYFRVHSKYDGNYDQVHWSPSIQYISSAGVELSHIDANLLNAYHFNAKDDFVLAGRKVSMTMPYFGTVKLTGVLNKVGITSDDININFTVYDVNEDGNGGVTKTKVDALSFVDAISGDDITDYNFARSFDVNRNQEFTLAITSDSEIDLKQLKWADNKYPSVIYTAAYEPAQDLNYPSENEDANPDTSTPGSVDDLNANLDLDESAGRSERKDIPVTDDEGNPSLVVPVSINTDIYSQNTLNAQPQQAWVADKTGVILVTPWLSLINHPDEDCYPIRAQRLACEEGVWAPDGDIAFTVKSNGRLLSKSIIKVRNKVVLSDTQGYEVLVAIPVTKGERYFFDFSIKNPRLANEIATSKVHFGYGSESGWKPPFAENVHLRGQINASFNYDEDNSNYVPNRSLVYIIRTDEGIIHRVIENSLSNFQTFVNELNLNVEKEKTYYFDFFTISNDFTGFNNSVWATYSGELTNFVAPKNGKLAISPKLNFINNTIDGNIELRVSKNNGGWLRHNYAVVNGQIPAANLIPIEVEATKNDSFVFEYVTSNHKLSTYLKTKGQIFVDYVDETTWSVPEDLSGKELLIQPEINLNQSASNLEGEFVYSTWYKGALLYTSVLPVINGLVTYPPSLPIKQKVSYGDEFKFAISSNNPELLNAITQASTSIVSGTSNTKVTTSTNLVEQLYNPNAVRILMPSKFESHAINENSVRHYAIDSALYGNPYRGWGYVGYYANAPYAGELLNTNRIRIKTEAELRDLNSPDTVYLAMPETERQQWVSVDSNWSITSTSISSSRYGLDEIDVPEPKDFEVNSARNVVRTPRRSEGKTFAYGGGATFFTVNYSSGNASNNLGVIDLNGDRYPDMVGSGHVQYSLPTGQMGETSDVLASINTTKNTNLSFSSGARPNLNGSVSSGGNIYHLGSKLPFSESLYTAGFLGLPIDASIGSGKSSAEIQMNDINGDGLPDRLYQTGNDIFVQLNMGYSFAPKEKWGTAKIDNSENQNVGVWVLSYNVNGGARQLKDMNGDGLPDYLELLNNNQVWVSFNTGNSFASPIQVHGLLSTTGEIPGISAIPGFEPMPLLYDGASLSASKGGGYSSNFTVWCGFVPCFDVVWGGGFSVNANITQPTLGFNDLNGDGLIDGVQSKSDSGAKVVVNATRYTNLLKSVTRPLGAKFEIEYKRTGNTYNLPSSRWVMSQVNVFDGAASDTPSADRAQGSDFRAFKYDYQNGKQDRFEREFLGFATVVQEELNTKGVHLAEGTANDAIFSASIESSLNNAEVFRKVTQTYLNDSFYTKGLLTENVTQGRQNSDGTGTLVNYRKSESNYVLRHLASGTELDDLTSSSQQALLKAYIDSGATLFPYPAKSTQYFFEGGSQSKSSSTENKYDDYGNVIVFKDLGEPGVAEDNVTANIDYSHTNASCLAKNITGKPTQIIVTSNKGEVRKRQADYYCGTTGNLKEVRQYLANGSAAVTKLEFYDNYGNLKKVTGPANNSSQSLTMSFNYDTATQTYPVDIRNDSYNLASKATYDYKFGKPLCTLDVNGNPMAYQYDSFGRTKQITGPYELPEGYTCSSAANDSAFTIKFDYKPYVKLDTPRTFSVAETNHYNRDANNVALPTINTWLFTDGIKRVLQTKKTAEVDKSGTVQVGQIVSGRVSFDALGRSVKQYYPTFETSSANPASFNTGINNTQATVMKYDALDRNISTILPDNTETTIDYDITSWSKGSLGSYFMTKVTDANTKQKTTYRDVRELIHGVVEEGNLLTTYKYDALKQITDVYDAENNHTHVEYDNLGRRTRINNPDTGLTEYKYDSASNLIEKITANRQGQVGIQYIYDHTRLLNINYPTYPDNNVRYVYGDSSHQALNQAGRIIEVTHQGGTDTREYGKLGEVTQEKRILYVAARGQGDSAPVATYITKYDFDTFGRLMTLTLPDTEVITHGYNAGGSVNTISGSLHGTDYAYLQNLTYDEFEQRRSLTMGNGIQTRYHYDPAHRRLCKLESGLTLNQAASNAQGCETFPREVNSDKEQNDLIDQMARITAAPKGQFQNINYAYDNVGNILGTANATAIPRRSDMGGPTVQTFRYDNLYRLTKAKGQFSNAQSTQHKYTLAMQYSGIHNIINKDQKHVFERSGGSERIQRATTYNWDYKYKTGGHTQPHAPTHIGNRTFAYDKNGNQLGWDNDDNGQRRSIEWDDENRIQKIGDPQNTLVFAYDDSGTRVLKRGKLGQTAYVNQFFSVRNNALASKHIFAGTSRIATKLEPGQPVGTDPSNSTTTTTTTTTTFTTATTQTVAKNKGQTKKAEKVEPRTFVERVTSFFTGDDTTSSHPGKGVDKRNARANDVAQNTVKNKHLNGGTLPTDNNKGGNGNNGNNSNNGNDKDKTNNGNTDNNGNSTNNGNSGGGIGSDPLANGGTFLYYYHPDHLGSTGYVTDEDAELYEHVEYFPFGETWVSEAANSNQRVPYRYTSKELDEETGLYYYGARYYDPRTSVWQSVDPILGKYLPMENNKQSNLPGMGGVFTPLNLSSYIYTHQNPVKLTDPDGNVIKGFEKITNALLKASEESVRIINKRYAGTKHPDTGIPYNDKGYPDFSSVAKETKTIKPSGDNAIDFRNANKAAGLKETPDGFTWHHAENPTIEEQIMQLVPTDIHNKTRHTGGMAMLRKAAAMASVLASDIANADVGDWVGFGVDMITPLGLESKDLGGGTDMIDPNNPPPLWEGLTPIPAGEMPPPYVEQ